MTRSDVETAAVGARVRTARHRLRLGRGRVARNAGLSRRELASFERGRGDMSVDKVRSLAGSLGVDVDELLLLGELDGHPAPSEVRIEDVLDVPDDLEGLESLPLAAHLEELDDVDESTERRKVPRTRKALDDAFEPVRNELDDVMRAADRMHAIGSEDDVRALICDLQHALGALRENRAFETALAVLDEARGAHEDAVREHASASWRSRGTSS
jgi:transcriptional regulator with XRE-family HTH domain